MCGISGLIQAPGDSVERAQMEKLMRPLARRGPDGEGVWLGGSTGFAHRRLSVIDISNAGAQPFLSRDGKTTLVYNGEIYNFRELRAELRARGVVFKSESDTEVILEAYLYWGEAAFPRLNGMFAFAISDRRNREERILLVRDRFGIKPLFYAHSGAKLAFSSLANALRILPWVSNAISPETFYDYLKFSHVPCPLSIFQDVHQLQPGHVLSFEAQKLTISPFRTSRTHATSERVRSNHEWLDELESTLTNVVKRQIVSDVPVGCFLSGGVDSSLLALTFAENNSRPIDTFTIAYGSHELNEGEYARQVAERVSSRHQEIQVTAEDLKKLIPDIPKFFDQPFADPTLLPSLILAREAKKRVTVALSGDGGDELFFGYSYQRALMRTKFLLSVPRAFRSIAIALSSPVDILLGDRRREQASKLRDILSFRDKAEFVQYFIGTIGPLRTDRLATLVEGKLDPDRRAFAPLLTELSDKKWIEQIEEVFIRTFLLNTVLVKTDRTGMAFGLEARVPFLDDEMVAFAGELPFDLKWRDGKSKYLLRELLNKKMPGSIGRRPKQGFSIPIRDWFREDLAGFVKETLSPERLKAHGLLRWQNVKIIVDEHLSGRANHSHLLFSMISFQIWFEGQN